MLSTIVKIRVRYCDVDRMGYLHHGNYADYFEVGRTELLRRQGLSYKEIEDNGIILPVRKLSIEYYGPAKYDDLIDIKTSLVQMEGIRLVFHYEVTNSENKLLCEGKTTLVFADRETGRPRKVPDFFRDKMHQIGVNLDGISQTKNL